MNNTPKTSNISLTKKVEKDGTEISSNMDFPFTILLDLDGDGNKYNYDKSILSTISSILKYYNVDNGHTTLKCLDKLLILFSSPWLVQFFFAAPNLSLRDISPP